MTKASEQSAHIRDVVGMQSGSWHTSSTQPARSRHPASMQSARNGYAAGQSARSGYAAGQSARSGYAAGQLAHIRHAAGHTVGAQSARSGYAAVDDS